MCCKSWVTVERISPECGKEKQEISDLNRTIAWEPATWTLTSASWWAKPKCCHVQQKQVHPRSYSTGWHRTAHEAHFLHFCQLLRDLRSSGYLPGISCLLFFPSACNKVSAVLTCGLELALQCIPPHCKILVLINSLWTAVSWSGSFCCSAYRIYTVLQLCQSLTLNSSV